MKVRTFKGGIEGKKATCRHCKWEDFGMTANVKARYHAKTRNHWVDVFVIIRTLVRQNL